MGQRLLLKINSIGMGTLFGSLLQIWGNLTVQRLQIPKEEYPLQVLIPAI